MPNSNIPEKYRLLAERTGMVVIIIAGFVVPPFVIFTLAWLFGASYPAYIFIASCVFWFCYLGEKIWRGL